ncbi:undecaprenyldiphospho-muramoylpentapeptide beta-N-acetylglucosaminyltransferase [Saccharibacillus endophyticus]|uniref:UDP-N-acetylglucosamine--N-acetylmuramyl-(pentapeptide) pyrophosphoryl-undecaprenol N-acetylglucosamine transferase n=1 Tax=Saccharibacillus endophyticus TaxID=2060666 RepID=A0ABQ1ZPV6_9BACL|nr:undecaprenyldiphospho-muramoylpentapeptide beta-N-acetylglucosaminyltransferase [Saccharibacillus endophyticus]GGH74044.1 UDP-N-acetylglucosamine--N-acetylmuramyl-(pentapeptide) pyrophosphoryl-undecaprenol N-acetylglucosamine transferase 1 [Saccharibacillus endophyticus]
MRVVLTGGGTGGHIYPALAIAEQLKTDRPDTEFLYIGGKRGLENSIVPETDMPFETLDITGFRRSLSADNIKTVLRFLKGVQASSELLEKFKPDVVVGTGGYVCGPVVYAAHKLRIPTLIHEQNAIPGLTNRFLSRYVSTVAVSFDGTQDQFPKAKRVMYSGNPRATTVHRANAAEGFRLLGLSQGTPVVLVVGGSIGAKAINEAMLQMVTDIVRMPDVHFVYVTGKRYYEEAKRSLEEAPWVMPSNLHVLPYVERMPEVLAASMLVISRAGASFLAEVTSLGIPAVLIPSPNVTNNHQEVNARALEDDGAAIVIAERDLSGESLLRAVEAVVQDEYLRLRMAECSARLGKPDSAAVITAELRKLAVRAQAIRRGAL